MFGRIRLIIWMGKGCQKKRLFIDMSIYTNVFIHKKKYTYSSLHLFFFLTFSSSLLYADQIVDATAIPFEKLLQTDYIPASHVANQISNASSAVSIVTARDIKDYGYRTLGEILGSMRGMFTFQDYQYTYLAGRGFSSPGEYAGRIAVLIDGYRADDSYYGQAFFGDDGILDVSMIERVEYIPGGSSAGYSNGALLGIINIITKKGKDFDGTQVAFGYGSHNSLNRRVTYGTSYENGDILISASDYKTTGRDFTYNINGSEVTQKAQNKEDNYRFFAKASYEQLSFEGGLVDHKKDLPSYPVSGYILDTPISQRDISGFLRLKYDDDIGSNMKLSSSLWFGEYTYHYNDPDSMVLFGITDIGYTRSKWYGGDIKLIGTWFKDHTLSLGGEYRYDYDLTWNDVYVDQTTGATDPWSLDLEPRKTYSLYGYDDFIISQNVKLNYGLRYEDSDSSYHALSSQIALIYQWNKSTITKISRGETNRQATAFENILYGYPANKAEHAQTTELVIEKRFADDLKLLASFYQYRISNRISYDTQNIETKGAEFEAEKHWDNGIRFHTSYAYQDSYGTETKLPLINAPKHIAKLNFSAPLKNERLRMGIDMEYIGKRRLDTLEPTYAKSYTRINMNLLSHEWIPNCDVSFKIRNIMNETYGDVVLQQWNGDLLYPQDGRTFWLELEYNFR